MKHKEIHYVGANKTIKFSRGNSAYLGQALKSMVMGKSSRTEYKDIDWIIT